MVIGVDILIIRLIVLSREQLAAIVKQPVSQRHIAVPVEAEEIGHGIPLGVEGEVTGRHSHPAPRSCVFHIFIPTGKGIAGALGIRHAYRNFRAVVGVSAGRGATLVQTYSVAQAETQYVPVTGIVEIHHILCAVGLEGDRRGCIGFRCKALVRLLHIHGLTSLVGTGHSFRRRIRIGRAVHVLQIVVYGVVDLPRVPLGIQGDVLRRHGGCGKLIFA